MNLSFDPVTPRSIEREVFVCPYRSLKVMGYKLLDGYKQWMEGQNKVLSYYTVGLPLVGPSKALTRTTKHKHQETNNKVCSYINQPGGMCLFPGQGVYLTAAAFPVSVTPQQMQSA